MAEKEFLLEIVTPENVFYKGNAEKVIVRPIEGDLCVLKNHEPYVAPLGIGKMNVIKDGQSRYAVLSHGYIKVSKEKVDILADTAEWADQIDVKRAEEAKARAEKRLANKTPDLDVLRAEIALKKAIQRIDVANMK